MYEKEDARGDLRLNLLIPFGTGPQLYSAEVDQRWRRTCFGDSFPGTPDPLRLRSRLNSRFKLHLQSKDVTGSMVRLYGSQILRSRCRL